MFSSYGDLPREDVEKVRNIVNLVVDLVQEALASRGHDPNRSIFVKPWSIAIGRDSKSYLVAFMKSVGARLDVNLDIVESRQVPITEFAAYVQDRFEQEVTFAFAHPKGDSPVVEIARQISIEYVQDFEDAMTFAKLGDIAGLEHVREPLQQFLKDHPNPAKNVFLMMRFMETPQMQEIHSTLTESLAAYGFNVLRADDRAYSDELWTNIEIYIAGCDLGIAIFEDIEQRDFNPNVAYELGYMRARRKRCLILKEKRLPQVPTDVIHRLYREFDSYNIHATVKSQIEEWVTKDLRAG